MDNKLFVGNLPYETTQQDLMSVFSQVGGVVEINVIIDRETGRGKGFAFVTMASSEDAKKAIEKLDGFDYNGRALRVNVARPQENRDQGGDRGPRRPRY